MSRVRLFAQPNGNFDDRFDDAFVKDLLADIDIYIERHKTDFWRRTGVARAKELQNLIRTQLIAQEELSRIQLMWRLRSYIEMAKGEGILDTSTELRNVLADRLCTSLKVDQHQLEDTLAYLIKCDCDYMVEAAQFGGMYYIDMNALQLKAKLIHVDYQLGLKGKAADQTVSSELKDILLHAIDAYREEVNAHWYKRWFKQSGLLRAEKLTRFICDQLVNTECLSDAQLCARVVEMASFANGEGILGTSKDLRIALMQAMSSWQRLNLNEVAIAKEIDYRIQPVVTPGALTAYFPNPVRIEVGVRAHYINAAMRNLHAAEHQNAMRRSN